MSQFIELIEAPDMGETEIITRFPSQGSAEIKLGAQLVVRESQAAVFFRDGRALDTFGPGRHTLSTLNIPLITKLLALPTGFDSPFRAEVVFVNLKTFPNLKWGTMEPILFRDTELAMVRLRAFGMYSFRIANPQVFINTLAATVSTFGTDSVSDFFRNFIVTQVADFLGQHLSTVLDLAQYYNELSAGIKAHLISDFEKYGVTISDFKILSISPPDHVQEMIDKRAGIAAVGNLDGFLRYQAGHALEQAATNPGGGGDGEGAGGLVGAGLGIGAGIGIGGGMAGIVSQALTGGAAAAAAACTSCGAGVPAGANFCPGCGTRQGGSKNCTSCGASSSADARFCGRCGNSFGA
jgi:membrane protease subunit (stomatin/prohibitin family)